MVIMHVIAKRRNQVHLSMCNATQIAIIINMVDGKVIIHKEEQLNALITLV